MLVEEPDERANGAGRVVVLGLAEQQRAAAFEVAQVDVVAERRADDAAGVIDGEHDLRLGVVPLGLRMDADFRAGADRRHRLALGEDLRVGTDADLEILRPHALRDEHVLEPPRLLGARPDSLQVVADDGRDRAAQAFRLAGVAARLLLDDAFEQAGDEGDAAGLDRLEIAGREEPGAALRAAIRHGVRQDVGERSDRVGSSGAPDRRDRIVEVQQLAGRRRHRREIVDVCRRRTRTSVGPCASGDQTRPMSSACA